MKKILGGIIVLALAVVLQSSLYTVPEASQVVITQFGKPVGEPVTEPGLHAKMPFVQEAIYVDKRIFLSLKIFCIVSKYILFFVMSGAFLYSVNTFVN